jgi:hypothetical protein
MMVSATNFSVEKEERESIYFFLVKETRKTIETGMSNVYFFQVETYEHQGQIFRTQSRINTMFIGNTKG